MSRPPRLGGDDLTAAMSGVENWSLAANSKSIAQDFKFKSFAKAWTFMCRIAAEAEKLDHHPDWSNSYNKVSIRLTTHDQGGLTHLDFDLAKKVDQFLIEAT